MVPTAVGIEPGQSSLDRNLEIMSVGGAGNRFLSLLLAATVLPCIDLAQVAPGCMLLDGSHGARPFGSRSGFIKGSGARSPAKSIGGSSSGGGWLMHRLRGGSAERGVQLAETDGDMTSMYLKHGFISVCEARFDASTAGKPMAVEEDGKALRNVRYGPSCARTGKPMYFGRSPPVHYIEMELKGGTAPDPDFKGEMTEKGEWLDYKQDGTVACSIGVMASDDEQEEPRNFGVTTIPDDSFVWYRHGKALWWFDDLGSQPAFFNVPCSDFKDSLLLRSGDRIGVLVDFHGSRLGFVRNGELVQELKRDLNTVVPRYHLHFVVGAMRPNTTWTMVPAAQAWESLKAIDWDEWVEPPECDSVLSMVRSSLPDDLWEQYKKDMGDVAAADPLAHRFVPDLAAGSQTAAFGPQYASSSAESDVHQSSSSEIVDAGSSGEFEFSSTSGG